MTYVHNFFKVIKNESKMNDDKKIVPKNYCIEKEKELRKKLAPNRHYFDALM